MLPEQFYRNVSDFGEGTTLNIKTVGAATIVEMSEDQATEYRPIETGEVQLTITDYVGAAWYITDELKEDGAQIAQMEAIHAQDATRRIAERFETNYLDTLYNIQADGDPNSVNTFAHRITGSGTAERVALADLINMQVAFDKANVPVQGRIGIVDPVFAAQLNTLATATFGIDRNPHFQMQLEDGFQGNHRFVMNLFGWDLYVSNLLPDVAAGAGDGTTTLSTAGKANLFMSILDDGHKPAMAAWRRQPKTEGERDMDFNRDKYKVSARWGTGVQRVDTLGVILTNASV